MGSSITGISEILSPHKVLLIFEKMDKESSIIQNGETLVPLLVKMGKRKRWYHAQPLYFEKVNPLTSQPRLPPQTLTHTPPHGLGS